MKKKVAIIGAGPSGLTATRQAVQYGFEPIVFEKRSNFGGLWRYSEDPQENYVAYSTVMNYSKELSAFSELVPPESYSNFMHHTEVLSYLSLYVEKFDLLQYVKFNTEVTRVARTENWKENGKWAVEYVDLSNGEKTAEEFNAVLVCSGMYSKPHRPFEWRWERKFQGRIIHSQKYRGSKEYHDKVVVIVGFGNSAVDCACDLAGNAKQVYLSTRRGSWLLNQTKNGGSPWDNSYNSRLSYLGRKVVPKYLRNWLWEMEANERFDHYAFGIQPKHRFLSANFTFASDLPRHLSNGRVKIKPNILSFTDNGVEFDDRSVVEHVDEVILCTGYKFEFPFLEEGKLIFIRENDFHLYKHMFLPDLSEHNNLALIGFVQPRGSMFPVVEMQARLFFHTLAGLHKLPPAFEMKRELEEKRCEISLNYLKTHRHTQIEDYIDYIDDLASAIGAKPSLRELASSDPKLAWKMIIGPVTAYQYRLQATHPWSDARKAIMEADRRMFSKGRSQYPTILTFYAIVFVLIYLIYAMFLK